MLTAHELVPLSKRPLVYGLLGGMWGIASVAGPLLGGAFTDHVSWRWCFYIKYDLFLPQLPRLIILFNSLPIGAISIVVVILLLKIPGQTTSAGKPLFARIQELDLLGASILVPAVVCLLLALQWGGSTYPWKNSRIIGLFVGFGALTLIFIYTQVKLGDRATLPPRILSQRTVAASVCFMLMFGAAFFTLIFYLPLYFQSVKNVSATKSGIDILPLLLSTVLSSIVAGGLITVFGYYTPFIISGTVLFCIGTGLISTYTTTTSFGKWFGFQILAGTGVGVGFQTPLLAVQTVLSLEDVAIGTACVMFFQSLGGALFIAVAQTVFQNGIIRGTREFAPALDPYILLKAGATEIRDVLARMGMQDQLEGALKAYMVGLTATFRVTVACTAAAVVAACFVEWRSVKEEEVKRKQEAAGALAIA